MSERENMSKKKIIGIIFVCCVVCRNGRFLIFQKW